MDELGSRLVVCSLRDLRRLVIPIPIGVVVLPDKRRNRLSQQRVVVNRVGIRPDSFDAIPLDQHGFRAVNPRSDIDFPALNRPHAGARAMLFVRVGLRIMKPHRQNGKPGGNRGVRWHGRIIPHPALFSIQAEEKWNGWTISPVPGLIPVFLNVSRINLLVFNFRAVFINRRKDVRGNVLPDIHRDLRAAIARRVFHGNIDRNDGNINIRVGHDVGLNCLVCVAIVERHAIGCGLHT